jgi:hypothetical protein
MLVWTGAMVSIQLTKRMSAPGVFSMFYSLIEIQYHKTKVWERVGDAIV